MYATYGNIDHQYTPVMLAYIPYMDPMGIVVSIICISDHSNTHNIAKSIVVNFEH